jgi:hypothetical protein
LVDHPAAVAWLGDTECAGVEPCEALLDGVASFRVGARRRKLGAAFPRAFDDVL